MRHHGGGIGASQDSSHLQAEDLRVGGQGAGGQLVALGGEHSLDGATLVLLQVDVVTVNAQLHVPCKTQGVSTQIPPLHVAG